MESEILNEGTAVTAKKFVSKPMHCYLDGTALCVVNKNFINLHESDAVFIELTEEQWGKIEQLQMREN